MIAFLALFGFLLLLIAVHPFGTYPLSLSLFFRKRPLPDRPLSTERPRLAICMSAYNEEPVIRRRVERLIAAAARYGNASIHIYADAPEDRTVEILREFGDAIDLVPSTRRTGKTFGMNLLVARSDSELLMFTDANVMHDEDIVGKIVAPFADPDVGCVSARLVYSNSEESAAAATGAKYWALEERIKSIESRTIGLVGVDGAMFAIRRAGHVPPPPDLIDDLYTSLLVLAARRRLVTCADALVSERSAVRGEEEFARKRRIACQALNVHRALWPRIARAPFPTVYAYVSHRLIRWLTPFILLLSGLSLAGALLLAGHGVLVAALALLGGASVLLGGLTDLRPFGEINAALLSLVGVAMGVIDSVIFKRTYTVWTPAESIRD